LRRVFDFRIFTKIADKDHLVDAFASHKSTPSACFCVMCCSLYQKAGATPVMDEHKDCETRVGRHIESDGGRRQQRKFHHLL
jgi:hypothetical protein